MHRNIAYIGGLARPPARGWLFIIYTRARARVKSEGSRGPGAPRYAIAFGYLVRRGARESERRERDLRPGARSARAPRAAAGTLCESLTRAVGSRGKTVQYTAHPNELSDSTLATVREATYGPRVLHALLLSRLRLLAEDLLHLSMSRHVLVHAPVYAGSLANAQVRLLEQRDALAEALLRHPAATRGCGSANGRESRTHC